ENTHAANGTSRPTSATRCRSNAARGIGPMRAERILSRRAFLASTASASGYIALARPLFPQTNQASGQPPNRVTPETKQAIDRGLAWLVRRQVISGREEGAFGHGGYAGGVAVSSLTGLAFMMSGSPPGQGPFGKQIDRCIRYITSCTQDSGYIAVPGGGQ